MADTAQRIGSAQLGGLMRDASSLYQRARLVVAEYPMQTIATISGISLAFGAALGLPLGHRR